MISSILRWVLNRFVSGVEKGKTDQSGLNLISADLVITGNITSRGDIYLYGRVLGDVTCQRLFLASDAVVGGTVDVEEQIVLPLEPDPIGPLEPKN